LNRPTPPDQIVALAGEALVIHIGELVKRLTSIDSNHYARLPWSAVARMRDLVAHHYESIDPIVIRKTLESALPDLEKLVLGRLSEIRVSD